jgi:hypothetical protein
MGEKRNMCRLLVEKLEGKRLLERPRHRWMDNIRMDLREVGWGDVYWIGLTQDRNRWRALVNSVLNLLGSIKCWETVKWSNNLTSRVVLSSIQLVMQIHLFQLSEGSGNLQNLMSEYEY